LSIIGFIAGDTAKDLESKDIVKTVMATLRSTYGQAILDPTSSLITCWEQNPSSYGSYSFVSAGSNRESYKAMAEPVPGRLIFAGEATSYEDPATVHGAYLQRYEKQDEF
jgi:monoamine oxidase